MNPVRFNAVTPVSDAAIPGNIAHAIGLGLAEIDAEPLDTLHVVANGPSAAGADLGEWVLALNGALGLFSKSSPPSMWAALDSQPLVADFIKDPDPRTTFLVNSRCHPNVFAKLKGFDVRLWHLDDIKIPGRRCVPSAISITLSALLLMRRLGWRRFEIWGWDCCLLEGAHHAHGSSLVAAPLWEVDCDGRSFVTTSSWLIEAQNAGIVLRSLEISGAEITVHGAGLVAHCWATMQSGHEAQIEIKRDVRASA